MPEPVSPLGLWEQTGKPVLVYLRDSSVFDPRFHLVYKDKLVYAAGIDESSVKRILDKIQGEKSVNSLDMAEIILNRISGLHKV